MFDMGVDAFLKQVNRQCESCGDPNEEWNIHVNPEGAYAGIPAVNDNNYAIEQMMPIVVFSCKNCGFIRMYTAESIQKMIEIQKALENQPPRMCELEGDC